MAQEIQRQLEEIEVRQKELEFKGVNVEKALRNKNGKFGWDEKEGFRIESCIWVFFLFIYLFFLENSESDFELMQELLNMMRERNELRKFEQKLLLKAKEIEMDDPYSRLKNWCRKVKT